MKKIANEHVKITQSWPKAVGGPSSRLRTKDDENRA